MELIREMVFVLKKHAHYLLICGILLLITAAGPVQAGFIVTGPQALDGQTVDWITITTGSGTTIPGEGTLYDGTLNVGVEGLANPGNFTIEENALFNADQSGPTGQYQGTINLGQTLVIKTGGQFSLSLDTLNARGRSDAPLTESLRMSGGAKFEADLSTLIFENIMQIEGPGSSMDLDQGSLDFGDKLFLRDGATADLNGVDLRHQDLGNPSNTGRVVVESQSKMNITGGSVNLTSGGGPDDGQNLLIQSQGQVTATNTTISARKVSVDGSGSTFSQTGGSLTAYGLSSGNQGEIRLDNTTVNSDYLSVNGSLTATDSILNLSNTPGAPRNLSSDDGTISLTRTRTNISNEGDIDLMGSANLTVTDSDISADLFLLRHTAKATFLGTTASPAPALTFNTVSLTGTNGLTISGYDVDVADSFDTGAAGTGLSSQVSLTGSTLDAGYARILNKTAMTADSSHILFKDNGWINDSALTLNTTSSLAFGDELWVDNGAAVTLNSQSSLVHKDTGNTELRGTIIVKEASHLTLNDASIDLSSGSAQKIKAETGSDITATGSSIKAKEVIITGPGSKMEISNLSSLTSDSLVVQDDGEFRSDNSQVHITGNTTRIESGGQMFINGGTYQEDENFIIDGGSLKAEDIGILVGGDLIVSKDSSVTLSASKFFIGDDALFDLPGAGIFNMESAVITMQGTRDDENDGYLLKFFDTILLGGLDISDSVTIKLMGDLKVDELNFLGSGSIDLNGFDLTVASSFSGDIQQIVTDNGGNFNYDPNQTTVPEPSTFLLMGFGILFWSKVRRKRFN